MSGRARLSRRALMLALACVALAPAVHAHRAQSVLTTVTWNEATRAIEVVHRIHAHDAELGLSQALGQPVVDLTLAANQARLLAYVEQRFTLADGRQAIELEPVGAEMEAEAVLVYQEARRGAVPTDLIVTHEILRDVFEGQTNLVNVRMSQKTRTLLFSGRDGAKRAPG